MAHEEESQHPIHIFPNSIYPFIVCAGITLLMFGLVFHGTLPGNMVLTAGVLGFAGGVIGWMLEDTDLYEEGADGHS